MAGKRNARYRKRAGTGVPSKHSPTDERDAMTAEFVNELLAQDPVSIGPPLSLAHTLPHLRPSF